MLEIIKATDRDACEIAKHMCLAVLNAQGSNKWGDADFLDTQYNILEVALTHFIAQGVSRDLLNDAIQEVWDDRCIIVSYGKAKIVKWTSG